MVGILVSFWETLFSGAMLVSGRAAFLQMFPESGFLLSRQCHVVHTNSEIPQVKQVKMKSSNVFNTKPYQDKNPPTYPIWLKTSPKKWFRKPWCSKPWWFGLPWPVIHRRGVLGLCARRFLRHRGNRFFAGRGLEAGHPVDLGIILRAEKNRLTRKKAKTVR